MTNTTSLVQRDKKSTLRPCFFPLDFEHTNYRTKVSYRWLPTDLMEIILVITDAAGF